MSGFMQPPKHGIVSLPDLTERGPMTVPIARRKFVVALAGAAVGWPVVAQAQQRDGVRRIGVLIGGDENDPRLKTYVSAFTQALAGLGWTDGRNAQMDLRWVGG